VEHLPDNGSRAPQHFLTFSGEQINFWHTAYELHSPEIQLLKNGFKIPL
jgi:hypothetical protein